MAEENPRAASPEAGSTSRTSPSLAPARHTGAGNPEYITLTMALGVVVSRSSRGTMYTYTNLAEV